MYRCTAVCEKKLIDLNFDLCRFKAIALLILQFLEFPSFNCLYHILQMIINIEVFQLVGGRIGAEFQICDHK